MSDRVTGFGQTIDEYEMVNGIVELRDAYIRLVDIEEGAVTVQCRMRELSIDDGALQYNGEHIVFLDDEGYGKICKLLRIPTPYILRLNKPLKKVNIEYWFDFFKDKEVSVTYKNGELIEITDGIEIKLLDLLDMLNALLPEGRIFRTYAQTNAVVFDVYSEDYSFDTENDTFFGGIRLVYKKGLKAPDISPIFINVNSCGIIECSAYLEKLIIKNLSYKDILRVIQERFENCIDALGSLFHVFQDMAGDIVPNPHRRIALYCREHGMPDRVRSYALSSFDESGLQSATYEQLIGLFSVLGYTDEVKQASERRLQQLAGYIISKAKSEHRCGKCDAQLNND